MHWSHAQTRDSPRPLKTGVRFLYTSSGLADAGKNPRELFSEFSLLPAFCLSCTRYDSNLLTKSLLCWPQGNARACFFHPQAKERRPSPRAERRKRPNDLQSTFLRLAPFTCRKDYTKIPPLLLVDSIPFSKQAGYSTFTPTTSGDARLCKRRTTQH